MPSPSEKRILRSLRRIARAMDLYNHKVAKQSRLTVPQLVCLRKIAEQGLWTGGKIARAVDLSPPTVTGILDRLESRALIQRTRDTKDKRKVYVRLTPEGDAELRSAPSSLPTHFTTRLDALPDGEKAMCDWILGRVADLMEEGGTVTPKDSPPSS